MYKHIKPFRVFIGHIAERIKGKGITSIYHGIDSSRIEHLRPSIQFGDVDLKLEAKEIVYITKYKRWFIPNRKRSVFHVKGSVNEKYKDLFDPKLFEEIVYPLLCSRSLMGTGYPHIHAMNAYLERVYPTKHPYRT